MTAVDYGVAFTTIVLHNEGYSMTAKPMKRTYVKPVLERISLVGEETAAVPNCKRSNGGGRNRTFPNPCRTTGGVAQRCRDAVGS